MLLAIDIGNTNITIGLYTGATLGGRWRISTVHERTADEYGIKLLAMLQHDGVVPAQIDGVVMASVVPPLTGSWVQACERYLGRTPLVVEAETVNWLPVLYDPPNQVGADRVVDAVAVLALYSAPACVVDFGTATTFDAIDANGAYLGGAIAPGIGIAADALFQRAAKLPRVDLVRPPTAIGRNTRHAMQSGLLFGYVGLVEGMVARFRRELGEGMTVIATGGLAEVVAQETDVIDHIAPWLTLEGLRIIYGRVRGEA